MSLLGRTARDPGGAGHVAVERLLRDSMARLDADPLFRRRLRSDVMNAWVAMREGIAPPPPRRRWLSNRMGSLGRACLVASVAVYASLASVMAASSQALPGEPLYAVKLRIEELRVEALPSHFHEELAINALAERVGEMERLAASGSLAEAVAMVPAIERQYANLERLLEARGGARSELVESRLNVVARLVDALPADLRAIVARLMPRLPLAIPLLDDDPASPSPSQHAAPASPAPAVDPPAAPDAEPNTETVGLPPERTEASGSDGGGGDDDEDDDDESDEGDD